MTTSARLAAHRAAAASAKLKQGDNALDDEPEDPNTPEDDEDCAVNGKKKGTCMDTVSKAEHDAAVAKAATDAATATNARWSTVMASTEYPGRETLAHKLLGSDMAAEAIVDTLSAAPKAVTQTAAADPAALQAASEEAACKEMKAAIEAGAGNSTVDASSAGSGKGAEASHDALWAKAIARVSPKPAN